MADVAKTWGKLSPKMQRQKEKSKVALLKVKTFNAAFSKVYTFKVEEVV